MCAKKIKLLYINDNIKSTKAFISKFGNVFQLTTVSSEAEALKILDKRSINVVIANAGFNKNDGLKVLKKIKQEHPESERILISGEILVGEVIDALNKSIIFAYISNKWKAERIIKAIQRAGESYQQKQEEKEINFRLQRTNEQLEFMLREKLVS